MGINAHAPTGRGPKTHTAEGGCATQALQMQFSLSLVPLCLCGEIWVLRVNFYML